MSVVILWQKCVADRFPDFPEGIQHICLDKEYIKREQFPLDTFFIFFVSIQMRYKLERDGFHPFYVDDDYIFQNAFWLTYFPQLLLNQDIIFLPFGAIKNYMYNNNISEVFIRPNSGNKQFPGQIININEIDIFQNTYKIDLITMCALSGIKKIYNETRVFICQKDIIMTPYTHFDDMPHSTPIPIDECYKLISQLLKCSYLPDAFVVDLCFYNNNVKIIELNSISTSGCYGITSKVSQILLKNIYDIY